MIEEHSHHNYRNQPNLVSNNQLSKDNMKSGQMYHVEMYHSNDGSPANMATKTNNVETNFQKINEEVSLRRDAYNIVYKYYPPNPILPKSF